MSAAPGKLVTLHYRIGPRDGAAVISTFGGNPATLALGQGELAAGLERCIAGAEPGKRYVFQLEPQQAFGERRDELVQALPRAGFAPEMNLEQGTVVEFSSPEGTPHAGIVRAANDHEVRVDFNHPLAGRTVRFEIEVLAFL
jgi:FKBP-type peptidyl-prolyl cis-trans isomerase SlpA